MNDLRRDYALLAFLADRLGGEQGAGKKALQKIVHLVTRLSGVESRYEFDLYTYGPFSRDLAEDMDLLAASKVLDVTYDEIGRSYHIKKGPEADKIMGQYEVFLSDAENNAKDILAFFSGKSAKVLEMYSTLFFVIDRKLVVDTLNDDLVVSKFLDIKPKYYKTEALEALKELRKLLA